MATEATDEDNPLVSVAVAQEHVNDPNTRFIEVDVDTALYDKGHIPGAVGWNWTTQLQAETRRDIASRDEVTTLLRAAGVDEDTTVILYGDHDNWFAAYAHWLLLHHGFPEDQLKLLDGGRKAWSRASGPFTQEVPSHEETSFELGEPRPELRAEREQAVAVGTGQTSQPLVDVRSPEEFTGEVIAPPDLDETAQRGGHIPGASNVPWVQAVNDEDGTFKSPEELEEIYAGQGIGPDEETIVYCRIGERSSHTWFALTQILGWPARNYDGSWTEYGNLIDVPIET